MTARPIRLRAHAPTCGADSDAPCARCGQAIGGPADDVSVDTCWRCHMVSAGDAYDRELREMFREPEA